jgi:hypothetical protein
MGGWFLESHGGGQFGGVSNVLWLMFLVFVQVQNYRQWRRALRSSTLDVVSNSGFNVKTSNIQIIEENYLRSHIQCVPKLPLLSQAEYLLQNISFRATSLLFFSNWYRWARYLLQASGILHLLRAELSHTSTFFKRYQCHHLIVFAGPFIIH